MNGELTARILLYEQELEKFEAQMQAKKPMRSTFKSEEGYKLAMAEWDQERFCDRPNKPGYERANND